jgi:imidazolonepropionase-like amidohydrolase
MNVREIKRINSVTVINPESVEILENHDIVIRQGIIKAIEPSKQTPTQEAIDGTGLYAIPGLIDTHVHSLGFLGETIPGLFDLRWIFRQQHKNLASYLCDGVTTIRDMGSALKLIRSYSRKAAKLKIQSPRILYAGPMFTVPSGYPHYVPKGPFIIRWYAGLIRVDLQEHNGEKYAQKMVDQAITAGARCIKVMYQSEEYNDERTKIPIIPLSLLRVIVERAHLYRVPVGIHHTYRKDLQNLLNSDIPFDSIEHLTTDEHLSNDEIKQISERGVSVSSTLMTYGIVYHVDELEALLLEEPERFEQKPTAFFKHMCEAIRSGGEPLSVMSKNYLQNAKRFMSANLKKLLNAGVKIVHASDSGIMSPSGVPHWELNDMVQAGMSPLEALKAATSIAADVIGIPEVGRIKPYKIADIVLLRANPLDDIKSVRNIKAVIRDGILVHQT